LSVACRLLGLSGLLGFLAAGFTPLPNVAYRALASEAGPSGHADAIVVLAAAVSRHGQLNDPSLRRAVEGIRRARAGEAPLLVLLGPRPRGAAEAEGGVRARLAAELGVPAAAVLVETRGLTTRGEAARCAERLLPRGARRILLVTSPLHLPRARASFESAGFEVLAAPALDGSGTADTPESRLALAGRVAREALARLLYRLAGWA
jgi:uncharacterized SAM-binding protein YcdF (DUF218 family)